MTAPDHMPINVPPLAERGPSIHDSLREGVSAGVGYSAQHFHLRPVGDADGWGIGSRIEAAAEAETGAD